MIEVAIYVFLAVGIFVPITSYFLARYKATKDRKYIRLALIWFVVPFSPYIVVETQTALIGKSLLPAVRDELRDNDNSSYVDTYKVLFASPFYCSMYVITPCSKSIKNGIGMCSYNGLVIGIYPHRGGWKADPSDEDAAWSDCGNADDNVFPPYLYGLSDPSACTAPVDSLDTSVPVVGNSLKRNTSDSHGH